MVVSLCSFYQWKLGPVIDCFVALNGGLFLLLPVPAPNDPQAHFQFPFGGLLNPARLLVVVDTFSCLPTDDAQRLHSDSQGLTGSVSSLSGRQVAGSANRPV